MSPRPEACCDPSSPSKRPFREQRRPIKYIHMPIFLFPTSIARASTTWPCPQGAPLKQDQVGRGGPTETHTRLLFLERTASGVQARWGWRDLSKGRVGEGHVLGAGSPTEGVSKSRVAGPGEAAVGS